MSLLQIVVLAFLSWWASVITLRTIGLWLVSVTSDSIVLTGTTTRFIDLFGYGRYDRLLNSPWLITVKYLGILAVAFIFFNFFYWLFKQNLLRKQLRQINIAILQDQPMEQESLIPEIIQLEESVEKMREHQAKLIEQEQEAQQAKNDLITNVSHDLRTPLTSILGYLSYIHEDRYRDEVELRHYTELVYGKAQRLHKLIDDLFDYTRLESTEFHIKEDMLDMVELLRQLVSEYERSAVEKEVRIVEMYAVDNLKVKGDGMQIMRLFENLFSNALRYGASGKKIDISAKKEAGMAIIEVSNYGTEIPASDLPQLFERFYKVDKNRTTVGTGLGLAIAKSIVERHGGHVFATSRKGKTTFTVKLPISER
ncbi:HAMP domain-containing histidine kinase [Listeria rocourtiae]|nr:HAMP domain-containing sensor histidine kinase [Listeria rocourtiae]MBC1433731.1 HAMP domain-containing histidine kinase [Listeria rocourtiae]MBC1604303.1 HAMP domain-containing histidine kinase [Listeria rocourtiae]